MYDNFVTQSAVELYKQNCSSGLTALRSILHNRITIINILIFSIIILREIKENIGVGKENQKNEKTDYDEAKPIHINNNHFTSALLVHHPSQTQASDAEEWVRHAAIDHLEPWIRR